MTLTEFLLARIAQDEEAAEEVLQWDVVAVSRHRLLAECEAKRRIIEEHKPLGEIYDLEQLVYAEASATCVTCGPGDSWQAREYQGDYPFPCRTLTLLALPYAAHPDYREEWKP